MKDEPEKEVKIGKALRALCFVGRCIVRMASFVYLVTLLLIIVFLVYTNSLENNCEWAYSLHTYYQEHRRYTRDCEDMGAERAEAARQLRRRLDLELPPEIRMDIARQLRELSEVSRVSEAKGR